MRLHSGLAHFALATTLTFGSLFSRASMRHCARSKRTIVEKKNIRAGDHKHPNAIPVTERSAKDHQRHRHRPSPEKKTRKRLRLNDKIGGRILQLGALLDDDGADTVDLIDAAAEPFDLDTFSQVSFGQFVDGEWRPGTAHAFSIDAFAAVFGDRTLQELMLQPGLCASCLSDPRRFASALGAMPIFLSVESSPGAKIAVFDEPMFKRNRVI